MDTSAHAGEGENPRLWATYAKESILLFRCVFCPVQTGVPGTVETTAPPKFVSFLQWIVKQGCDGFRFRLSLFNGYTGRTSLLIIWWHMRCVLLTEGYVIGNCFQQEPVILTGTNVVTPALRWTLPYLEENMGSTKHTVYLSKSRTFMYYDEKKVLLLVHSNRLMLHIFAHCCLMWIANQSKGMEPYKDRDWTSTQHRRLQLAGEV